MAEIKPFPALCPQPDLAARVCAPPYDVVSTEEARALAKGNPLCFLHVSRPEIDLPPNTDPHADAVYARGKEQFRQLIAERALVQDAAPAFYLYRQTMGTHCQTGIVAVASCADYLDGTIRKHELTRPDKENDRMRHIEILEAQTGPAFFAYRAVPDLDQFVATRTAEPPFLDFVAADQIRHSGWRVADAAGIEFIQTAFARLPRLYIADGHHRSAAAVRVSQARAGQGHSGHFLAVIFPHDQLQILPYHRVLKDLNGLSPEQLLARLDGLCELLPDAAPQPNGRHQLGLYLAGQWHGLQFRPSLTEAGAAKERLDVALLQRHVLEPIFGITDPRTSERIGFVGGGRGVGELARLVDCGEYACAFSLFPTSMDELMSIADAGEIMPPKSTWFEPKLRDAMFCHLL